LAICIIGKKIKLTVGINQRHSLSGAAYSYVGVGLGFLISGLLFPRILSTDQVGLLRVLVSYSTLLAQFAVLGFNTVTVKLFPFFRNEKKGHHGFLGFALLIALSGFILTTAIYLGLHHYIVENAKEKSQLFVTYYYYVIPMMFFTLLFGVFDTYYRVLYNAVTGIAYKEVVQRILIIISIVLFYFGFIDFKWLVIFYTIAVISPSLLMLISLIRNNHFFIKPDFKFIDKALGRQMIGVAFFGIVASYSGVLVQNIDLIMVDHYLGLSYAGIYAITFFFGTLILIPLRTMGKISSVVIADSWKNNDLENIRSIYQKSTLTLGIAGVFLFVGIWGNIDNIFHLVGKNYEAGKYVILFIGLANLCDVFSGISPHIIVNSPKYRWLSYLLILFAGLVIVTNWVFIPLYGIVGAALASFISKLLYTLMKHLFLYKQFGLQPYTYKHLILLLLGAVTWYLSSLVPPHSFYLIDILIRSLVISLLFLPAVYYLKISEDFNGIVRAVLLRFKR
jgi:O-antigen/teichoic acid export membrane protein